MGCGEGRRSGGRIASLSTRIGGAGRQAAWLSRPPPPGLTGWIVRYEQRLDQGTLVFVGRHIQLFKGWSHAQDACIADVTCVLVHYPFTSVFYDKVSDAAATKRYGYLTSDEYDLYRARLSREPGLTLRLDTARRYAGVESVIDEGFLVASPDYLDWTRAQRNG